MSDTHTITIWDSADSHYKEYVTDECLIDECPLAEHDKQIRADAIDECIKTIERHCFAWKYKGIAIEDVRPLLEQLKEQTE